MACGCRKNTDEKIADSVSAATVQVVPVTDIRKRTSPLEQCLFCAQKHADEALCCMNEFTYELENRSFVHGAIRSVVNHTFKTWPEIATVARKAALLWQEAHFKEAQAKLLEAIKLIDAALLADNPEIQARVDAAKEKPDTVQASGK